MQLAKCHDSITELLSSEKGAALVQYRQINSIKSGRLGKVDLGNWR